MGVALIQTAFASASALPKDVAVNTFHFRYSSQAILDDPLDVDNAFDLVENAFYKWDNAEAGTAPVTYLGGSRSGLATSKMYDLAEPQPRVPIAQRDWTFPQNVEASLPLEVACVLSFHAALVSGTPPARLKNRIFLGPLTQAAVDVGTVNTSPRPSLNFRGHIARAAGHMLAEAEAAVNWDWVAYSSFFPIDGNVVVGGWVDNDFDTIRGRQPTVQSRLLWDNTGAL